MARRMKKQAFIAKADRPEVKAQMSKSVAQLSVRDLSDILSKSIFKHFKDHTKELKIEKIEHKELKIEKVEKIENKELKLEKYENEPGPKHVFEPGPDPKSGAREPGPDWGGFDPVTIDTLVQQVAKLSQAVADLQKRLG